MTFREILKTLAAILPRSHPKQEASVNRYPRDFRGHGPNPPDARWPGGARIAVSIVLNYEEGGENNILHGDAQSEAFLSDIAGAAPWPGQRHWNMESIYDYGARAGFWRLHRLLRRIAAFASRHQAGRWEVDEPSNRRRILLSLLQQ